MITMITFQNKKIPVFHTSSSSKAINLLTKILEDKYTNGKNAVKRCLNSIISIEIDGSEAILHSKREFDTLALSLY